MNRLDVTELLQPLAAPEHPIHRQYLAARGIVERLQEHGHETYFVGGAVRDLLLGRPLHEFDITTGASPDEVKAIFRRTVAVGEAFGVVCVVRDRIAYEVATFRCEEGYSDGRHPDEVRIGSLAEDVLRRDFTVNGMVLDPLTGQVTDLVGGLEDLGKRTLRAIGEPAARLSEDYLRTLRAVRFAACLEFAIEPATAAAVKASAVGLSNISRERVRNELEKMCGCHAAGRGLRLLAEHALADGVFHPVGPVTPGTVAEAGDLLDGMSAVRVESVLAAVALTMRRGEFGDLADGRVRRRWVEGCAEAFRLAVKERRSLAQSMQVMVELPDRLKERLARRADLYRLPPFDVAARLLIRWREMHGEDATALRAALREAAAMPAERLDPPPLVDGRDLSALGLKPGPHFGKLLQALSDEVVEGTIRNRTEALAWLQERIAAGGSRVDSP